MVIEDFAPGSLARVINQPILLEKRSKGEYAGKLGLCLGQLGEFVLISFDEQHLDSVLFLPSELDLVELGCQPPPVEDNASASVNEFARKKGSIVPAANSLGAHLQARLRSLDVVGNVCPSCEAPNSSKVLETRSDGLYGITRRRRECLDCQERFSEVAVRSDHLERLLDQLEGKEDSMTSAQIRGVARLMNQLADSLEEDSPQNNGETENYP